MQLEDTVNIDLTLEEERKILSHYLGIGLFLFPKNCPACNHSISIKENDSLNNPYLAICRNSKCRKTIYLRTNTLFGRFLSPNINKKIYYLFFFKS